MQQKVYSYIRFSTPEQAKGHSLQRQLSYAREYAEKHNLVLDESLTLRDEGLSAYHQKHITEGAFGIFLSAVRDGKVAPGSLLIIEALDRISRAEPMVAQSILSQIIMAGITVITASDNKVYEREAIKKNPMDLVYSVLLFVKANEESENKSRRVKDAIVGRIEYWIKYGHGKLIRNGRDPSWLKSNLDKTGFEIIPERVETIKEIINLYNKGWGYHKLSYYLNDNHTPFGAKEWYTKYIFNILRSRTLIGERDFTVNGKKYVIKNYYPAILTNSEFINLKKTIKERASTKAQRKNISILTGMKLSYCGLCGDIHSSQNHKSKSKDKKRQNLSNGYRRIRCSSHSKHSNCPNTRSISIVPIEHAILEYCADKMELASVLGDTDQTASLRAQIATLHSELDQKETMVANGEQGILDCLTKGIDITHVSGMVNTLKDEQKALQARISDLEQELHYQSRHKADDVVHEWQTLKEKAKSLDEDTRLLVRQLVKRTFKRIDIFLHGMQQSDNQFIRKLKKSLNTSDNTIDLILTFPNDNTRILSIDKKSGQWIKGGDIHVDHESTMNQLAKQKAAETA